MADSSEDEYDAFADNLTYRIVGAMHAAAAEDGVFAWFRLGTTVFVRPDGHVVVSTQPSEDDLGALAFPILTSSAVRELRDVLLAISSSGLDASVINASMSKIISDKALDTAAKTGIWIADTFFDALRAHGQLKTLEPNV